MDTGWRIYLIEGTYAERISTRLNPAALPLGYIYPIFIFTTFAQILFLSLFSRHQGVWARSNAECMGMAMARIVPV